MPIRVVCKHCGKKFSAWDDLIGKAVKCPKCQQEMVVHSGNDALDAPPASAPQVPRPTAGPPLAAKPTGQPPTPSRPATPPRPVVPAQAVPPPATSGQPYAIDDLDDSEDLPYACPHCHQSMPPDEDLCDNCGYHRVLKRRIDVSEGINKPDKSVGFERFFKGQLADKNSEESTLLMLKIVGGVLAAAFIFICFPWSLFVAFAIGGAFLFYKSKQKSVAVASGDPSALNQDPASSMIWSVVLSFQRAVGWRHPEWPFPTTTALTLHDSTFTDDDLNSVEDLSRYETLDLEGTQLSNASLQTMEQMKQLRYIVVRRTNVTVAGVQRLQQALPKASVWY